MEKQKKKRVKRYISWVCLVALVAALAVMPLIAGGSEESDGPEASILSGTAALGDIDTVLVGGGTLVGETAEALTVPASVKLTELLVSNGDAVSEGDAIARVDRVSVMTAITEVQDTLDYLSEAIDEASEDTGTTTVTAQAGGTVKILYAQKGDKVQDVMLEHGALAVLSLDGLMAVQVERGTDLAAGDLVYVTFGDGTEVEGRVESNVQNVLTVTINDEGYAVGETVKVTDEDGGRIGSGQLYIHSQWNATAYSGTVSAVNVSENKTVSAGTTLMKLTDTGNTAAYHQLTAQRREYETMMLELFQMYQSQTLTAPCDGVVTGLDENGTYMLSAEGQWTLTLLANAPNGDDETSYVNFAGQVTAVGIDGLVLKMNPQPLDITDYKDLSAVPLDTALMTEDVIYSAAAPVYELADGEWTQIEMADIAAGDILLFAGDEAGNFVWVVRAVKAAVTPEEPEATEPTEPESPTEPENPAEPTTPDDSTEPTNPSDSSQSGGQSGGSHQSGGSMSGFGSAAQEEEYELYSLDTVTVASVTPQTEMTLEITIDELDISKLHVGQSASISVGAISGQSFDAVITAIGATGTNEGGSSKFTVELTVPRSAQMLNGMNATAVITLATASNVVTIPTAALCDSGAETVVYTTYDEESGTLGGAVTVTTGVSDGENVQILTGLSEGDTYYYAYYDTLEISNAISSSGGFSFSFGGRSR